MELEYLNYVASVRDDFSSTLDELSRDLVEVGSLAEAVDDRLDLHVDVDDSELDDLKRELGTTSVASTVSAASPDGGGGGTSTGRGVTADGGGGDFLSTGDIRRLRDTFGDAFDEGKFLRQQGQVPDWWSVIDERELATNLDFDADLDMLTELGDMDLDDALDFFEDDRGLFRQFRDTISSANFTMNTFYNIVAQLIPLISALVAALPAAIAGLGSLAIAGVGLGGGIAATAALGGMGFAETRGLSMEEFTQQVRDRLSESFMESVGPLSRQFSGLFEDGLTGMETFFERMAERGQVLTMLRDDARALGGWLLDVVPVKLEKLVRLGDAASGVFAQLGGFIETTDFTGGFAGALAETLPSLARLGGLLYSLLPVILDLSEGFLMAVSGALTLATGLIHLASALQFFENVTGVGLETVGLLVGSLLVLSSAFGVASTLGTIFSSTLLTKGVTALAAYMFSTQAATVTTWQFYAALGTATLGLAFVAGGAALAAQEFDIFGTKVDGATSSLRDFARISGQLDGSSLGTSTAFGSSGGTVYIDYTDNSQTTNEVQSKDDGVAVTEYQSYRDGSGLDKVMA